MDQEKIQLRIDKKQLQAEIKKYEEKVHNDTLFILKTTDKLHKLQEVLERGCYGADEDKGVNLCPVAEERNKLQADLHALRWHKVSEELPEVDELYINTKDILVMDAVGEWSRGSYSKNRRSNGGFFGSHDNVGVVVLWKYAHLPDEQEVKT